VRLDAEWLTLSAIREMTKLAAKGDVKLSTYDRVLDFGAELYPELLGRETSLLRRFRESDTAAEFRQIAHLRSLKENRVVKPDDLIRKEINEVKDLLEFEERQGNATSARVDRVNKKLHRLIDAASELETLPHTENQLIFRDCIAVGDGLPQLKGRRAHRDFRLPDGNVLRVRVLHPDKPEHVTGADIIYERHVPGRKLASVIAVQYKIWEKRSLSLSDPRLHRQLSRLKAFLCDNGACAAGSEESTYRFPFCAAFLKPCDKLQHPDQALVSSGEHLPICMIDKYKSKTKQRAAVLEYANIHDVSLNSAMFELLFNRGKIGSRTIPYFELAKLYAKHLVERDEDSVIIHAQEFAEQTQQ
jgi:hypothetical protein